MWHVLHLIARPIEAFLGFFFVISAFFLYPSEEGKIQSKLEDLWIQVAEYQHIALSRHRAFMTLAAQLETKMLDSVFGASLTSGKALGVSLCLSIASISIAALVISHFQALPLARGIILLALGSLLSSVLVSRFSDSNKLGGTVLAILGGFTAFVWPQAQNVSHLGTESVRTLLVALLSIGVLCDIAFILVTRKLIRWAEHLDRAGKILGLVTLNLLIAGVLLGPGLWIVLRKTVGQNTFRDCTAAVSMSNVFDALFALLYVVLVLTLLIHALLWPLLNRALYYTQDLGTKGRRSILTSIGLGLLWLAVSGGKFPEFLKEVLKAFGG
jgi:hypothetical protein